jgi:hypothetical protein
MLLSEEAKVSAMEYCSAIKKNEIILFPGKCMELLTVILSEINQSQKD